MTYDKQKVLNIALGEVGYLEKASSEQLDSNTANAGSANITKYARDLDAMGFYNGRKQCVAWCDVFVDWCFAKAYGKAAALSLTCQPKTAKNNAGAGCKWSRKYYEDKGQFYHSPEAGDQIFFGTHGSESHTGLVIDVEDGRVYTVEGNTSGANGVVPNGGGVFKKSYPLNYAHIVGYGRPKYGEQVSTQESEQAAGNGSESAPGSGTDEYTTYTVKRGDTLGKIAKAKLGKASRYKELAALNNIVNPNRISIGQKLKIPKA